MYSVKKVQPIALLAVPLVGLAVVLRLGTFDVPPTWDAAMSVWPAAIEISSDWDIGRVLDLPTYTDGGPNTHTLSLITLVSASLLTFLDPSSTYLLLHVVGVVELVAIALLVVGALTTLGQRRLAFWAGAATVSFPLLVGQSAYLYTELPSALLSLAAIVAATKRRPVLSAVALALAISVKPLAAVVVPVVVFVNWAVGGRRLSALVPLASLIALVPALLIPQVGAELETTERVAITAWRSQQYLERSPELLALPGVPLVAGLTFRRTGASRLEWMWLWLVTILLSSFVLFFVLNAFISLGHFFIPRYAALVIPPSIVLLFLAIARLRNGWLQVLLVGGLLLLLLLGVRGPLAWGLDHPAHPIAERSLAFVSRVDEQREGLRRLAEMSDNVPAYYDHFAHYAYTYPELLYVAEGELANGVAPSLISGWGEDLMDLPDRFVMLVGFPYLGGNSMRHVQWTASDDPRYKVQTDPIGSTLPYPLELVTVERLHVESNS